MGIAQMKLVRPATMIACAAALSLPAGGGAIAEEPGTLQIAVTGLRSARGQLIVCLWRDKAGFPDCAKSRTALRRTVAVTGQAMTVSVPLAAAGRRAVTVVHDEDGNGRMKQNFIGMPIEGVGVSNNPGGMPGYAKSLVDVAPAARITVRMKYLFD